MLAYVRFTCQVRNPTVPLTKGIRAGRAFVELVADDSKFVRGHTMVEGNDAPHGGV
jgi:hypothetical protein